MLIPESLIVLLAPSCLITLFHRAFAVGRRRHRVLVIVFGGGVVGWRLLHQLLQPFDAYIDHVGSLNVFWRCYLLAIVMFVCSGQISHHV